MAKTIVAILIIFVVIFTGLLGYKTLKPTATVLVPVNTNFEAKQLAPAELKQQVETIIKEYLMQQPEIIIQAIEQLQKRKMQQMEESVNLYIKDKKAQIEDSSSSPILGNSEGDVVIVVFYDYNCSYCKKAMNDLTEGLKLDKGVKLVLRPFPVLGEVSEYAAKTAVIVHQIASDKFALIHDGLVQMKNMSKEAINKLLVDNNLEVSLIEKEMSNGNIQQIFEKNSSLAENLKIRGVPAYIINSKIFPGLLELKQLQQIISEARATAKMDAK